MENNNVQMKKNEIKTDNKDRKLIYIIILIILLLLSIASTIFFYLENNKKEKTIDANIFSYTNKIEQSEQKYKIKVDKSKTDLTKIKIQNEELSLLLEKSTKYSEDLLSLINVYNNYIGEQKKLSKILKNDNISAKEKFGAKIKVSKIVKDMKKIGEEIKTKYNIDLKTGEIN